MMFSYYTHFPTINAHYEHQ